MGMLSRIRAIYASILPEDVILDIFWCGAMSGAASAVSTYFHEEDSGKAVAMSTPVVKAMMDDPAARFEALSGIRSLLRGEHRADGGVVELGERPRP